VLAEMVLFNAFFGKPGLFVRRPGAVTIHFGHVALLTIASSTQKVF
jgi:hypothetical protein